MNVARLIGSVGGYFYSVGDRLAAVHMYGGNSADVTLGGTVIRISQETDYPWSGRRRDHDRSRPAGRVRAEAPGAGMGARSDRSPSMASRRTPGRSAAISRLPPLALRRPSAPVAADAGRAHPRPPGREDGHRPGRAEARPAESIAWRGSITAAVRSTASGCRRTLSCATRRGRSFFNGAGVIGGRGGGSGPPGWGEALYRAVPPCATRRAHRHPLLPVGQPRAGEMLVWIPE